MNAIFENQSNYEVIPITIQRQFDLNFLAHWHVDVEFILVLEGNIQMGINTEQRLLEPGDIAICCSNSIHYFASEDYNSNILIKFLPEFIEDYGAWQKNHNFKYPFIQKKMVEQAGGLGKKIYDEMIELFYKLYNEMNQQKDHYPIMIKGMLLELCGLFLRHLPKQESSLQIEHSLSTIQIVQESLQYIEENYMNTITLDEIAKRMNVSSYYFSRIFNNVIGMNLKTYQNIIRLNKAENMLISDKAAITDIAYECGFNSVRTFNRCFRLVKGYRPSDLRKTGN